MKSIVTKKGDDGTTGLLYGGRVSKDDPRTEAYGTTDEAGAALGLARAWEKDPDRQQAIQELQAELFTVGAELATDAASRDKLEKHFPTVDAEMVARMDKRVADLEDRVPIPQSFVLPGATPVSASLNLARTLVRRAERRAVTLQKSGQLSNPLVITYLNRCSDYVFMLVCQAEMGAITPKGRSAIQR